jgi:hypothetical protein
VQKAPKKLTRQQIKQALASSDPAFVRLALDHRDYEAQKSGGSGASLRRTA